MFKKFVHKDTSVNECIKKESNNNFKLIRLIAACMVIYAHSFGFTNERGDPLYTITNHVIDFSYLGLSTFFFLSGLLVSQSLFYSSSWKNFLWKRFLRLYPAAWFVILISMLILGPAVTTLSINNYFINPLLYNYAISLSLVRITYYLPGVFTHSVMGASVNAPLWSISLELKLYIGLLIFYLLKIPFKRIVLFIAILVAFIIGNFFYNQIENKIKVVDAGFLLYPYVAYAPYFLIGVVCFIYRRILFMNWFIFLIAVALIFISLKMNFFFAVRLFTIPILVLCFAALQPRIIKKITPKPDLSYGLYVFAFPVQQLISQLSGTKNIHAWQMTLLCVAATCPFAICSWYLIEKKALSFKNLVH